MTDLKRTYWQYWIDNGLWWLFAFLNGAGLYQIIFDFEGNGYWGLIFNALGTIVLPIAIYISWKKRG